MRRAAYRGRDGLSVDEAVALIGSEHAVTVVAEADGRLVGMVLGTATTPTAWIHRVAVAGEDPAEVADDLLEYLEAEFTERGVRHVASTAPVDGGPRDWLERRGYEADPALVHVQRTLSPSARAPHAITRLGGRMSSARACGTSCAGLEEAKELIERRVILPLAEPLLAERHGGGSTQSDRALRPAWHREDDVRQGIALRLGWPFVELEPSRLGGQGAEGEAAAPGRCLLIRCSNSRPWWLSSTRSRTSPRCASKTAA